MTSRASSPSPFPHFSSYRSQSSLASYESHLAPLSPSSGPLESKGESAPFKPSLDDDISLDMHRMRKGKREKHKRHPNRSDQSEEEKPLLSHLSVEEKGRRGLHLRESKTFGDSGLEGFDCSLIRQDSVVQYRRKLTNRQQLSQVDEDTDGSVSDSEQQTISDTLRFARASSIHRKRGESLIGSTAGPVASWINAVCISSEQAVASDQSDSRRSSLVPTHKHRSRSWNASYRAGNRRRPSVRRQETPATITLRKASQVLDVERGSRSRSIANRFFGWFQESENSQPPKTLDSNRKVKFGLVIPSHDTLPVHQHRLSCVAVSQSAQSSLDLLKNQEDSAYSRPKRHSVTADFALTYAEIQPTYFACSCSPGREALVAMGGQAEQRRPSRSRVRIGSSVHEIIWDKDDSPDSVASYSFTSSKSASLSPVTDRGSVGQSAKSLPTLSLEVLQGIYQPKSATFPQANSESICPVDEPPSRHEFSNWSWQSNAVGESLKRGKDQLIDTISAKGSDSQTLQHKREVKIASVIDGLDTVESFPPLLNRKKTLDWQRLPLVDLHDPRAGREEDDSWERQSEQSGGVDVASVPIVSILDTTKEQEPLVDHGPHDADKPKSILKHEPESAATKLAHARRTISSRELRRPSANLGISKASRIAKHRRSISDSAGPDVAGLLAQASHLVRNSLSISPREDTQFRRSSRVVSTRRSKSVQSLSSSEEALPVTTQDPSVRLIEVAGADEGEGEDVGCLVMTGNGDRSRLGLSLDWIS